jgi:P27 family predicted phage terminase small subunit
MPRGRPPKPDSEKRLAGNPGKRRARGSAAAAAAIAAEPPDWLDQVGKAKWLELAPQLAETTHPLEPDILAAYCQAWTEFLIATAILNSGERTFQTDKGYVGAHPAVSQQRSAMEQMRACAKMLGLAEGRRPPPAKTDADADPLDKFIAERK